MQMPQSLQTSSKSEASGRLDSAGSGYQASGSGDWIVNFANPSLTSHVAQSAASVSPMILLLLIGAGAAWYMLKK